MLRKLKLMTEEVLMQTAPFKNADPGLQKIADKVYAGQRLLEKTYYCFLKKLIFLSLVP